MSMEKPQKLEDSTRPARRAYEPPAISWEEEFEPASQVTGCSDVGDQCTSAPEV